MRANQANILANSAESYGAFIAALLAWGRCQEGQEKEPKFTTLLESITARTLVVTSDNDHLIPRELSELIAARIPGAKLVVMPGAGHIPFMEQPEEAVRIVLEFIASFER
jgi:pimeloyl-ACP methyl ester carboxylesterase